MSACIICTNVAFRGLPMHDKDLLAIAAREFVQGMLTGAESQLAKRLDPKRPRVGTCIVERCARVVEISCGGCRQSNCVRCEIAAELRAAEDRINADRDAELAELGDAQIVDDIVGQFVDDLCAQHAAFGPVLASEWYGQRRAFSMATAPVTS